MSNRRTQVAGLIQERVATFIQQEANTNPLITVTGVELAPNFQRATILFTTIPTAGEADASAFLQRNATNIRHELKRGARLKHIPHLEFRVDRGERHRQHLDTVVQKLEQERESGRSDT